MNRVFNGFYIVALLLAGAFNITIAADQEVHFIKPGSIGLAYLVKRDESSVTLKIDFDASFLEPSLSDPDSRRLFLEKAKSAGFPKSLSTFNIGTNGNLLLFNKSGITSTISRYKFEMAFWCENDGGVQYRPRAFVTIPVNHLKKIPNTLVRHDNFFSFAGIGKEGDFLTLTRKFTNGGREQEEITPSHSRKLIAEGRMSDGRIVARLVEEVTEAGCTSIRGEVAEDIRLEHEIEAHGCTGEWQCGWKCGRCCGP